MDDGVRIDASLLVCRMGPCLQRVARRDAVHGSAVITRLAPGWPAVSEQGLSPFSLPMPAVHGTSGLRLARRAPVEVADIAPSSSGFGRPR